MESLEAPSRFWAALKSLSNIDMIMKKKIYILFGSIIVAGMVSSCDLDLTPKGSISYDPSDDIITNESDMSGFEAGVMATLRGLDYGNYDITPDLQVDEFNATMNYGNNYGNVHRSTFVTSDSYILGNYSGPFGSINTFNIYIAGSQNVPDEFKERAAIGRGEAYLGRALAYMHMARHFAKPYGSTSSTDLCVPKVVKYEQTARPYRATVQEIYDLIKSDLDSAAYLLQGVPGSVKASRPTIDVVNAMYARYYLDIKDYSKAAASALAVINTGNYKLSTTVEELLNESINDDGTEAILQFHASVAEGGAGEHGIYVGGAADEDGIYFSPGYIPSKVQVDAYEPNDIRLAAWYDDTSRVYLNGQWFKGAFKIFSKYRGNPSLRTDDVPNSSNAIKPFLISEMYLIAAESYAQSGQAAQAKQWLNVLQSARGTTLTDGSMANIKKEWFRETVGEGLRFSCLKRWGDGFSGRAFQDGAENALMEDAGGNYSQKSLAASDYHWVWPMPDDEIQRNRNIVQNDGYQAE